MDKAYKEELARKAENLVTNLLNNASHPKRNSNAINYFLSESQLKIANELNRFKKVAKCKATTRYDYLVWFRHFCSIVKKPVEDVTKRDIEDYILAFDGLSPVTQSKNKRFAKIFMLWFYEYYLEQPVPEWIRKIPVKRVKVKLPPSKMLNDADIEKMCASTNNPMHITMVKLLYESGLRAGELVGLSVGDVSFDGAVTTLWADGKSGEGVVYLFHSTPYLMSWLRTHPARNNPAAPLFFTRYERVYGDKRIGDIRHLGRSQPNMIVKRLAFKAGITDKRVYAHLFRKSSATNDAEHMTDAMMRLKYRWSPNSQEPAEYASVHHGKLKEKLMQQHGLIAKANQPAAPIECPTCHFVNEPKEKFCANCYRGLTIDEVVKTQQRKEVMNTLTDYLMTKDGQATLPKMVAKIREFQVAQKRTKSSP